MTDNRIGLQGFIDELEKHVEDIPKVVSQIVRGEAFNMTQEYVLANPVGNPELWAKPDSAPAGYVGGHSRRNWQVTVGAPTAIELPGVDEVGADTIEAARAALETLPDFPIVFIDNPVPYVDPPLNEGHSSQIEPGWLNDIFDRHSAQFAVDALTPQGGPE